MSFPVVRSKSFVMGSGPSSAARSASRVMRVHTVMEWAVGSVSLMPVAWWAWAAVARAVASESSPRVWE